MFKLIISIIGVALLCFVTETVCAAEITYVYTDPQGTPLAEADASGNIISTNDYRPFGSLALGNSTSGVAFTGQISDSDASLVYMQARYYDGATGRFLSIDPLRSMVGDPSAFNRYSYANNSPFNYTDPTGMAADDGYSGPGGGAGGLRPPTLCQLVCVAGSSDKDSGNKGTAPTLSTVSVTATVPSIWSVLGIDLPPQVVPVITGKVRG